MDFKDFIIPIVQMLAGLGAFLIGVKIMSDSMTKLANAGLKKMFQHIDNKSLLGVGIGVGATAIIQSSAVTTVMVVGFVNAGVMSLFQATTVIMGANIGTTVTAQLAALNGFDFMQYVVLLAFVGFLVMSIAKKERTKTIGFMIAGLGLIFLALEFMSSAMSPFTDASTPVGAAVQEFLHKLSNPFLLLFIGIVLTFVMQSSSALTTIIITMASSGLIIGGTPEAVGNGALFVILGSNIGTCFTTMLASANASANAKRAAFIHFLFNFAGSAVFFVILVIWRGFMDDTFVKLFSDCGTQLAMFHTLFNVLCTALFLPLAKLFVKFAELVIPDKKKDVHETMYIDDRFLPTPSIAIAQAVKEVKHFGDFTMQTCDVAIQGLLDKSEEAEKTVLERLAQSAEINKKITGYLVNISAHSSGVKNEDDLSRLYYVLGDILRVGDLSHNITKYTKKLASGEVTFSQAGYGEIRDLYGKIRLLYDECLNCFVNKDFDALKSIEKHEDEIDAIKRSVVNNHIERLNKGECDPASNGVFINLAGNLERMADHLTFIAESITRKTEEIPAIN
ncbi:MAG: Na/Pi cotransporter family protein [Corallococcus sp.]|nr:Na/Pi cotransporter family protein [Corallococcus sp.]